MKDAKRAFAHIKRKIEGWRPTDYDKKCLSDLQAFMDRVERNSPENQTLYFKLYAYLYGQFLTHYGETPLNDEIAQKELHRILNRSTGSIINELVEKINMVELEGRYLKGQSQTVWDYADTMEDIKAQAIKAFHEFNRY